MSSKRRRQVRRRTWPTPAARQPWVHNEAIRLRKQMDQDRRRFNEVAAAFRRLGDMWMETVIPAVTQASASMSSLAAALSEQSAVPEQIVLPEPDEQEAPVWA